MSPEALALTLHDSAYPARQRRMDLEALRKGYLPGQALYATPAQAQRWLAYHQAWSPSRSDATLRDTYFPAFEAAAQAAAGQSLLVGIGCGGGTKDGTLLATLAGRQGSSTPHYAPIDVSPMLVAEAALHAGERVPGVNVHPLVADLGTGPDLSEWLTTLNTEAAYLPRVLTCFGMLPNMPLPPFTEWLANLLHPLDSLLISANLSPSGFAADADRITAQYDNAAARAWYAGALSELGFSPEELALRVTPRPLDLGLPHIGQGEVWDVAVEASLRRGVTLTMHGETLTFLAGETLSVFHSRRFTHAAAVALLGSAGIAIEQHWIGAGGEEGVFLCRKAT